MGGFRVGIEIPLLSWSLHLLGEAEWAGGGRVSGPRGFRWLGRLSAFILVLKGERSSGVVGFRGGGFSRGAVGPSSGGSAVFRGLRLAGPRPRAKLFRDPIRAEDSVRWGV